MAQVVQCPGCHKSYAYNPQLAGKRVKCKCGGRIEFPLTAPADEVEMAAAAMAAEEKAAVPRPAPVPRPVAPSPQPVSAPEAEGAAGGGHPAGHTCPHCQAALAAGAVLCTACGFNLQTGATLATEPVAEAGAAPAAGKKRRMTRKTLAVMAAVLVVVCGLLAGVTWMWGYKVPGLRKVPVLGWLARTHLDECRKFIPDEAVAITFLDVKSIRKSQPYRDDKASLEGMMNGALQGDKSIDAVDAVLRVTGKSGSLMYIKFNSDQPKERVFPQGRPPQQGKIDSYTSYVILFNPNPAMNQEAVWLDARNVLLGSRAALLSAIAHYDQGTEATLQADMSDALDWAGVADLIDVQAGKPTGDVPRARVSAAMIGTTISVRGRIIYGDSQAATKAVTEFQKAQSGANAPAEIKGATVSQNGNAVEIRMSRSYTDAKKMSGFGI